MGDRWFLHCDRYQPGLRRGRTTSTKRNTRSSGSGDDLEDLLRALANAGSKSQQEIARRLLSGEAEGEGSQTIAVIGRHDETVLAEEWPGHEVLNLRDWTLARNDRWVQSVIERKMRVYVVSRTTWPNLWDSVAGRPTVFARELEQFSSAGYTWDGWTLVPPGGG
jgi:hypothetical protein